MESINHENLIENVADEDLIMDRDDPGDMEDLQFNDINLFDLSSESMLKVLSFEYKSLVQYGSMILFS